MRQIIIGKTDNGKSFEVSQNDLISINLPENPTTGYLWQVSEVDNRVVKIQDSTFSISTESGIGAGGMRILSFKAESSGTTNIRLNLRRGWEPEQSAIEKFGLIIHVS
jgi:inhibitor of cysteine peptidase